MSHPAWVCGLKLSAIRKQYRTTQSHPAWVCGLKPAKWGVMATHFLSHPAWVCGLKHATVNMSWQVDVCHTLRGCVD